MPKDTDKLTIRTVQNKDANQLAELILQLGYPISIQDMKARIDLYNKQLLNQAWVAEHDNHIIASVAVNIIEPFHSERPFARVVALIVDKRYRGKGIGKILMQKVEAHAEKLGCVRIELTSAWHRKEDGTHDFYKNLDYSVLRLYLAKER